MGDGKVRISVYDMDSGMPKFMISMMTYLYSQNLSEQVSHPTLNGENDEPW